MRPLATCAAMLALTFALFACGEPDDGAGDLDASAQAERRCAERDAIMKGAVDGYCAQPEEACCYCQCYNEGEVFDVDAYGEDGSCICLPTAEPDAGAGEVCSGGALADAKTCLADEAACAEEYRSKARSGCLMSTL